MSSSGRRPAPAQSNKRFPYDDHEQLRRQLGDVMAAYNFARGLKTLNGLTPYEYIGKIWTSAPDRFIVNQIHRRPGRSAGKSQIALAGGREENGSASGAIL